MDRPAEGESGQTQPQHPWRAEASRKHHSVWLLNVLIVRMEGSDGANRHPERFAVGRRIKGHAGGAHLHFSPHLSGQRPRMSSVRDGWALGDAVHLAIRKTVGWLLSRRVSRWREVVTADGALACRWHVSSLCHTPFQRASTHHLHRPPNVAVSTPPPILDRAPFRSFPPPNTYSAPRVSSVLRHTPPLSAAREDPPCTIPHSCNAKAPDSVISNLV
ncbi:hypothetical protein P154DRAFT_210674 [Amniculicola lignicola CBS 123094]|uniref:Uncharacterized protein n=1 Tax=Amniculicola lignicola CBS 123094 TaxID=1392246 RepID=A0A6A5WLB0_9PLEO|nr:hypothetical protein P154DRAFT_210674 [Amniculicola lignicola CBS 123094]